MTHTKSDLNLILRELERQYSGDSEMARRIRLRIATAASRGSRRGRSVQRHPGVLTMATVALVALACITAGDVTRPRLVSESMTGIFALR
jgi:hypothetical protein